MNIVIDLRALQSGNISGVEVFTEHITRALIAEFPEWSFYLWTNSQKSLPESFPEFAAPNAIRIHTKWSNKLLLLLSAFFRKPALERKLLRKIRHINPECKQIDCFLIPDPRPTPLSKKCPKVMVVHDLSPLHFPKNFSLKTRLWHFLLRWKKEIAEATAILTPSHFTKKDVQHHFQIPAEKVTVVGAGVSERIRPVTDTVELEEIKKKYQLPDTFFLTLSTLEPRKNLQNLLEAFLRFRQKHQEENLKLVVAGKANSTIFRSIALKENPAVYFPGFIEETDKAAIFSLATAFLYPSFFEGFGLPVLEAMACGTPIMSSNAAALPEVYGDAALDFSPAEISEMIEEMEHFYASPNIHKKLAAAALARAQLPQFFWSTIAQKAGAVIKDTVRNT